MRLVHLPRVAPWRLVGVAIQRVESKVVTATFKLMSQPVQPELCAGQLTLPLRYGGMGIPVFLMIEAKVTFLSAAAVTEKAKSTGPPTFRPSSNSAAGPGLGDNWLSLDSATAELWPIATWEVDNRCISKVFPRA